MLLHHLLVLTYWVATGTAVLARLRPRDAGPSKYLDPVTGFNFTQFTNSQGVTYRIAIPSNATQNVPFDIALQVVAPMSTTGWAGLAWGGHMQNDPLAVTWAGASAPMISSRHATQYAQPQPYSGASYTVLPTSTINSTHYRLDVVCQGCSQWFDQNNNLVGLNPGNTTATFAYAFCSSAVSDDTSNTTTFSRHNNVATFTFNLNSAKVNNFDALVQNAKNSTTAS